MSQEFSEIEKKDLEKVYVDLPNHWAVSGESLWAKPLGNDLFEIHNVPFYAYGLNYFDIVKVDSSDPKNKPVILEVVEPSNYQTLRVVFYEDFDEKSQTELFDELRQFKVDVERDNESYVALNIYPDGDYDGVYNKLSHLENEGILEFETCETHNSNNFDVADE